MYAYSNPMANNIDKLRKARGFTVQQLADKMGISRNYLYELKNGVNNKRWNSDTLAKAAKALNCKVSDILDEPLNLSLASDNPTPYTIDEEVYEAGTSAIVELIEAGEIELSYGEFADEVIKAYEIGLEVKQKMGSAKPITIATKWKTAYEKGGKDNG
jgi:transcriptional regulator with XRE-family HTH domain